MAIPIFDRLQLDELTEVAEEKPRYQFLFTSSLLGIQGATGSPFTPCAHFGDVPDRNQPHSMELRTSLRSFVMTEPTAACEICDLGNLNLLAMVSAAAIPVQWPPIINSSPAFPSH